MRRRKQLEFFKPNLCYFGGLLSLGRRKGRRPLSKKDSMHLVMRSSWAKGHASFLKPHHYKAIMRILRKLAKRYGVTLYRVAIASNHIHLLMRIHNRALYATFIRVLSSQIASQIMNGASFREFLKTMEPTDEVQGKEQQFWQFRPFTRVLHWGRDYNYCRAYLLKNNLEAWGFIRYTLRPDWYRHLTAVNRP